MNKVILNAEIQTKEEFDFSYEEMAERVCRQALLQEEFPADAEIELTVTGPEEIHEINREYRNVDRETDVLSFPNLEYETPGDFSIIEEDGANCMDPENGCVFVGSIVINAQRVREQAKEYGHSNLREYAFLVAHSMMHLCGYDHVDVSEEEAALMEEKQEQVLKALGIGRESVTYEP